MIGSKHFTDEGLLDLAVLSELEVLDLYMCDNLTNAGVEALRAAFPDSRIN